MGSGTHDEEEYRSRREKKGGGGSSSSFFLANQVSSFAVEAIVRIQLPVKHAHYIFRGMELD